MIKDNVKLIRDFLAQKGYHILEAEDGEKAIEIFEKEKDMHLYFFFALVL